jgi:hypothetical protein
MKKPTRDEANESSFQTAHGELMGIEEERQAEEREEARRRAAAEARRKAEEEARRRAEAEARVRAEAEARRAEERAREEEAIARRREADERELRIRAEAEARVRAEELRRAYDLDLQLRQVESGRRRIPPWLAPSIAVLSLGTVGLFTALYFSAQAGAEQRLAEAERAKTSLKVELEREIDAARAERLTAVTQLSDATRRFEDAQRRLNEQCAGIPVMVRPPKPRPGGSPRPAAAEGERGDDDLADLTEKPPWEADDSEDTIKLGKDSKKKGKSAP